MSTESAQVFFSLLMFLAAAGCVGLVGLWVAAGLGSEGARSVGVAINDVAVWLAFLVAAVATAGSLYFSEVANFVPCRLCWYQRIAMYPLSVVLLVGAVRNDRAVRWYAAPLAAVGALVAGYHTLIEWKPSLDGGACEAFGPSCTDVWFREFGFVSLATMSLVGFLTILLLLFVNFARAADDTDGSTPSSDTADQPLLEHSS